MIYEEIIAQDTKKPKEARKLAFKLESSTEEEITYLKDNLSPFTSKCPESLDLTASKPFPYKNVPSNDSWTEEAENQPLPKVPNVIIIQYAMHGSTQYSHSRTYAKYVSHPLVMTRYWYNDDFHIMDLIFTRKIDKYKIEIIPF